MTQQVAITYGSLTLGSGQADDNYTLTDKVRLENAYDQATLTFEVVISATTQASFLTSESTLLDEFRKPDQALTVNLGGSARYSYDPSDNSGFNLRANAEKVPSIESTDRSARYRCQVRVALPADLTGRAGRQGSSVNVSTDASGRRTVEISGTYTALSNNSARAQFEAQVDTYANSILTDLTGTWEQVGQPQAEADDQNKLLTFRRVYREIKQDQSLAGGNSASIINPTLAFRVQKVAAEAWEGFGQVEALTTIACEYEADIAFDQTTDLRSLWISTIRPFILSKAAAFAGTTAGIVKREEPAYVYDDNRIRAQMLLVANPSNAFTESSEIWTENLDNGTILRPVWNGNKWARDKYEGIGSWTRRVIRRAVGPDAGRLTFENIPIGMLAAPTFDGFEEVRESRRISPFNLGIPGEETPYKGWEISFVYVRADVENTLTQDGSSGVTRER